MSSDSAKTWTSVGFEGMSVPILTRHDSLLFVVANGELYCSKDSSLTWANVTANLMGDSVYEVGFSKGDCFVSTQQGRELWYRPLTEILSTPGPLPSVPALLTPRTDSVVSSATARFTWSRPEFSRYFQFQLSFDSTFGLGRVVDSSGIADTALVIQQLGSGTSFFWRVRSYNTFGYSPWSPVRHLRTIIDRPSQVVLVSPQNGATVSGDSVRCRWKRVEPEVGRYWFENATDSLFAHGSIDSTVADTVYLLRGAQRGSNYWWKVKAYNNAGWGPFSETWKFAVSVTGIPSTTELPAVYALSQNYPNPFNSTTVVNLQLPVASHVRLAVYDLLGREVSVLVEENLPAGVHRVYFEGKDLASGVYVYRLRTGSYSASRRMILMK